LILLSPRPKGGSQKITTSIPSLFIVEPEQETQESTEGHLPNLPVMGPAYAQHRTQYWTEQKTHKFVDLKRAGWVEVNSIAFGIIGHPRELQRKKLIVRKKAF
jgi:hypothetical protein